MPKFEVQNTDMISDLAYQNYILQGVSRTFALTIPQLPDALVNVVGNGYLLCRLADTIEDDACLDNASKYDFATQFIQVVNGFACAQCFADELLPKLAPQTPASEQDLVKNTARIIRITRSFSEIQQQILAKCVHTMLEGMAYFQATVTPSGLATQKDMDSYCYHVAGVVGEMLTELYCDYSPVIAQNREQMLNLAVSFGQGLQMTNILKDIWDDQKRGACWLPQELFSQLNINLAQLPTEHLSNNFATGLQQLIAIAHAHLRNALSYTLNLPKQEKGLRKFCLWAIGMAILNLRKLNNHLDFCDGKQVKISRNSVKMTILLSNLAISSNRVLKALFFLASWGLPQPVYKKLIVSELKVKGFLNL